MPTGIEREKYGTEQRNSNTERAERGGGMQREETDRMGQMERGHAAEVQPDCMTEAYTEGISETHIKTNATVFHIYQMCNDLIMRMPSRLLVETITGGK